MQKSTLPNLMPAEFAAMGKKRLEEFTKAQTEFSIRSRRRTGNGSSACNRKRILLRVYFEIDGGAIDPGRDEGVQEWTSRRFEMIADDGKHLLADTQKFIETGARLVSNGWLSNLPGAST